MPMLYVKAAGNDGSELMTEYTDASSAVATAALNRTLIVGSVNAAGTMSGYSNRPGDGCLIAQSTSSCSAALSWKNHFLVAPGEGIYSAFPDEQLGYMSGTSMATPVVSGVAALLQARWPFLKGSPETLSQILLTSATDLGDPGVDPVYGYGLLNAAAAFVASGSVTIVTPVPPSTDTTAGTTTSSTKTSKPGKGGGNTNPRKSSIGEGSFANLASQLGSITVFDRFGRDFRWDETGSFSVSSVRPAHEQIPSRHLLGRATQDSWAPAFFAEKPIAAAFTASGSETDAPGAVPIHQPSLRAGIDVPLGRASMQMRLTGTSNPRSDLAFDALMRPLAFFASTDLASSSVIANLTVPTADNSRLMVYGLASTGAVQAFTSQSIYSDAPGQGSTYLKSDSSGRQERQQNGVGVGWWKKVGSKTVVGVNISALNQKSGFYDTEINVAGFDQTTRIANVGAAMSHAAGNWDFSVAGEVSHLRMSNNERAISFSPTTFVSTEVSVGHSGLMFDRGELHDTVRVSLTIPPRAVSGNLQLDYMSPTADGLDVHATRRRIPVAELGHQPAKLELGYRLRSDASWSLELSAGLDVERLQDRRAAEGLVSFRSSL
jgi:hypothetical protein